jgi:hypothetical protein
MSQAEPTSGREKIQREHVAAASGDIVEAQIASLQCIFPEAFIEGKIDFDRLRATLALQ